jgi:hypothetical protein
MKMSTILPPPPAPTSTAKATQPRVPKTPPIVLYGVTNSCDILKYLAKIVEEEQYYCKALPNETVKININ